MAEVSDHQMSPVAEIEQEEVLGMDRISTSTPPTPMEDEPKLKGRKRLMQKLRRISSSASLTRLAGATTPRYRGTGQASMSCVSLSSTSHSPYPNLGSSYGSSRVSNGYSTAPTSVPVTPGIDSEVCHQKIRFVGLPAPAELCKSPTTVPLPSELVRNSTSRPGTSAGTSSVQDDYFSQPISKSKRFIAKRRENFDFWGEMPPEIRMNILKLLGPKEVVRCSSVSRSWHKMCFDGQLWSDLDTSDFYRAIPAEGLSKIITYAGPFIRDLNLRGCVQLWECWRSAGLADVCKNLEYLSLEGCRIDRTCLHDLFHHNRQLIHINISGLAGVTNATMKIIAEHCPNLEHLNISWCGNVDVRGLRRIVESLEHLRDLRAGEIRGFDDLNIMQELFKRNTLERLILMNCDGVNDESLTVLVEGKDSEIDFLTGRRIVTARNLKHLDLSRCRNVSDTGLKALVHNMPNLEGLQLSKIRALTDLSLKLLLPSLPRLTHLDLEELENLTNATLQELARSPCRETLQHLSISYCENLGDVGMLPVIKSCRNLSNLELDNTRISDLVLAEAASMVRHRASKSRRRSRLPFISTARTGVALAPAGPMKPRVGLRMVVYDCQNVTWTGIREVLSRNAEIRRPTPLSFLLPSSNNSARSRALQAHASATQPALTGIPSYPHQIISLKVFYGYQPTVTEHTRRVLRGDLASASRLERKWAEYMMASEEAGAAAGTGNGTGRGHALGLGLGQGLGLVQGLGLGNTANRRRRRRVREAQMMHADEEEGLGTNGVGGMGLGIGRRRRARSGGGCVVM